MANVDAPFGLRPIRYRSGAPYNGACNRYYVESADTTAIFVGDPITYATGNMTTAEGTPYVTRHTAGGNAMLGVCVGVAATGPESTVYRAASTGRYLYVADDPSLVYEIQNDGNFSVTQSHHYGDIIIGTGSTVTGLSAAELDTSTLVQTGTISATATLRVLRLSAKPNNVVGSATTSTDGAYAVVEVMINQHAWELPTTT